MRMHSVSGARVVLAGTLAIAVSCGVSACAPGSPAGSGGSASGGAPIERPTKKPSKKTTSQLAAAAYREVVADPQAYFKLEEGKAASATFSYALVQMTSDEFPQLLMRASGDVEAWMGVEDIRVFTYDAESDSALMPDASMATGVASAGGFRGGLGYSAYGNGLLRGEHSSGTGIGGIYRVTIENGALVERYVAPIDMSKGPLPVSSLVNNEIRDIAWVDASDASALDALEEGEWATTVETTPDMAALAQEAGLTTFTGTLRVLDAEGVCALQGEQNLSPGYSDPTGYAVLDLGGEVELTFASGGGGQSTRVTSILALNKERSAETWRACDGMQVTVVVDPNAMFWPSDASVPVGAPRCRDMFAIL